MRHPARLDDIFDRGLLAQVPKNGNLLAQLRRQEKARETTVKDELYLEGHRLVFRRDFPEKRGEVEAFGPPASMQDDAVPNCTLALSETNWQSLSMTLEHLDTIIAFVVILAGVSLLVTVLTQSVSALLGLRGSNLCWGIETLLKELDPNLSAHAAAITREVLRHPLISDSTLSRFGFKLFNRWKLASVIRKDELIEILRLLARPSEEAGSGDRVDATVSRVGHAATWPHAAAPEPRRSQQRDRTREGDSTGRTPDSWQTALFNSLKQLDQETAADLELAAAEIKKLFPDDPGRAEQIVSQVMRSAEQLPGIINQWFDSVMDRVSQRFVTHTRIWTIIFSILVAFALHLDALKLVTQLSTDAEMRSRLVASADALTKKADEILVAPASGSSTDYMQAMKRLIRTHPTELAALEEPSGFTDLAGGKEWLSTRLQTAGIQDAEKWQREYELLVPQAALLNAADNLRSIWRDKLIFQLIPDPYPSPWYNYWTPSWLHFWGTLASAALLSVGAPFWFNALKTLTSFRPVLANKEQQERKGSDKDK